MNWLCKATQPTSDETQCLIVAVFENQQLSQTATLLDNHTQGLISQVLQRGDIKGNVGETLVLYNIPNIKAERILLVGCGNKNGISDTELQTLMRELFVKLNSMNCKNVICYLHEITVKGFDLYWLIRQLAQYAITSSYSFSELKSENSKTTCLEQITFHCNDIQDEHICQLALQQAQAIAKGMNYCRQLADTPANICTPTYLAKQAKQLSKEYSKQLKIDVLEEKEMQKLGMGSLLAVSQGSIEPAKLIIIEYNNAPKDAKPYILVGKGVTFDTGGISLKPPTAMLEMKYDMCGAASVFGTLKAVCELKLPINLIGVIAAVENMPSDRAVKPSDIVKTMSGQTVEIMNTDAEGRLILCDALTYCKKYNPETIIDIATLTGGVIVALGRNIAGLYSNDENLLNQLNKAAKQSHDKVWPLPIPEEYQTNLNSNFADFMNVSGTREAHSIMAACFLSRFTKEFRWAHLDIAGVANITGANVGATGRPVPLLTQYLINQVN